MLVPETCLSFVLISIDSFEYHLTSKCRSMLLKKKIKFLNHADYSAKI